MMFDNLSKHFSQTCTAQPNKKTVAKAREASIHSNLLSVTMKS